MARYSLAVALHPDQLQMLVPRIRDEMHSNNAAIMAPIFSSYDLLPAPLHSRELRRRVERERDALTSVLNSALFAASRPN